MPEENTTTVKEIQIIDEDSIRDKIHVIRGVKVMLDFDLAVIYGYSTSAFNQQVKTISQKLMMISVSNYPVKKLNCYRYHIF